MVYIAALMHFVHYVHLVSRPDLTTSFVGLHFKRAVFSDIKATEVLNIVDVYLTDEFQQGRSIPHLYEIVQYHSNILPRL